MKFHKILTVEEQVKKLMKYQRKLLDRTFAPTGIKAEELARSLVDGQKFIENYSELVQIYALTAPMLDTEDFKRIASEMDHLSVYWRDFCNARQLWARNLSDLETGNFAGPPKSKKIDTRV